jgi:hypothetical protein
MSLLVCTRACRGSSSALKALQLRRPLATIASDAAIPPKTYDDSFAFTKNLTVRRTAKHGADTIIEGPMRLHLGIEVNPNHGLYAFFRKAQGEGQEGKYLVLDPRHATKDTSGLSSTPLQLL